MLEVVARRVNADKVLLLLGLRADSNLAGRNSRIRPFADIDPLAQGTKMLPPYRLRRLALCAAHRHTTWTRLPACMESYRDKLKALSYL
jgi:hypothetical protein